MKDWDIKPDSVLVIRKTNFSSSGNKYLAMHDFEWPLLIGAQVTASDWNPAPICGGGLHGLLWGEGETGFIWPGSPPYDRGCVYHILEVKSEDIVNLGGKIKFPSCTVQAIFFDYKDAYTYIKDQKFRYDDYMASIEEIKEQAAQLSKYPHKYCAAPHIDRGEKDEYLGEDLEDFVENFSADPFDSDTNLICSAIDMAGLNLEQKRELFSFAHLVDVKGTTQLHTLMIDLDVPATLVPSGTEGHSHLYIDVPMTWKQKKAILDAMADANVVELGFASASDEKGAAMLRVPWKKKKGDLE